MASNHYRIKSGKKGQAKKHLRYISRIGRFIKRDDLVYSKSHNLPPWARNNAGLYFGAADLHERENGATYREHEIGLPNELNVDELNRVADSIAKELAGNKPSHAAVHLAEGKLGGIPNPHLHLMVSDRVPDGFSRSPAQTFMRFNAKRPELGGCRKDSGGLTPIELARKLDEQRKKVATCINKALEEAGSDVRVDPRSLRDQGKERPPERRLGPKNVRGMSAEDKAEFTRQRPKEKK